MTGMFSFNLLDIFRKSEPFTPLAEGKKKENQISSRIGVSLQSHLLRVKADEFHLYCKALMVFFFLTLLTGNNSYYWDINTSSLFYKVLIICIFIGVQVLFSISNIRTVTSLN